MGSKALTGVLLAALISGAGAWVVWARQVPTEGQVLELIETRSPYVEDRKELAYRVTEQTAKVRTLEEKVGDLQRDISEVKTLLKTLIHQVDKLDKKLDKK